MSAPKTAPILFARGLVLALVLALGCGGGGAGDDADADGDADAGADPDAGGGDAPPVTPQPGAPAILSFQATQPTLPAGGGDTVLTWQVVGATSLSIDHGIGEVTGDQVTTTVDGTTVFTLTATNDEGATTSITAVSVGHNPSASGGRRVDMVAPTGGEAFVAPASLRLVASGRDPSVFTNQPTQGHGGNAAKVQFFVDDQRVLEVDGGDAEYWIFKGFARGIPAGRHRVWARAIYVDPALVLDSAPVIVDVGEPTGYAQTIELTGDVVLSGSNDYTLAGAPGRRIRLVGNGHRIRSTPGATGALTLRFVDVFDLGDRADTAAPGIDVTTRGAVVIEDSSFDGSNPVHVIATDAELTVQRNLFRSNMRMPIGQFPDPSFDTGATYPVAALSGTGTFSDNNVGASYVALTGSWSVERNVMIGPRVGLLLDGDAVVRGNFSHHVYFGGWSQGANFELGGDPDVVTEHNVIVDSSWPVRGVAGEFRYNLVLEAGHQWLWADHDGASIHHNVFVGGEGDVGGLYVLYDPDDVRVFNNTIDGLGTIERAIAIRDGDVTLTSNLFHRVRSGVTVERGSLTADHNLFSAAGAGYSTGARPPHDVTGADPLLAAPGDGAPFDLDAVGVWRRTLTVPVILGAYRDRYTPRAGSPAIDAGDPAGGAGNDIGAVGAGAADPADRFGRP